MNSRDRDSMMREMEGGPPPPGGPPVSGDKSTRSVFVGNIPYEATEEKLKDIFSEVLCRVLDKSHIGDFRDF